MNILCATDNAYVPFCGIMLTSLFENNKGTDITVYVLTDGISSNNEELFSKLCSCYGQRILLIQVSQKMFEDCPIRPGDHISLASYYRLVASELLPQDVQKVIYLDCDVIVAGSLSLLWDTDISGYPIGACVDEAYWDNEKYERLGVSKETPYINAGVLLMNIEYWRMRNLSQISLKYVTDESEKLLFHDQDTINCLFHNCILQLPLKYNLQTGYLYKNYMYEKYSFAMRKEVWNAIAAATIIHFTGCSKPWHSYCSPHPYSDTFWKYQKISLWKDKIMPKTNLKDKLMRLYNHLLYGLSLVKQPETYVITHIIDK